MCEEENNNLKRHPHADIIHAWAEGQEIQFLCSSGKWVTIGNPEWSLEAKYRIKPKTKVLKFRNCVLKGENGDLVPILIRKQDTANLYENKPGFVKWLGPWQEVEVEE